MQWEDVDAEAGALLEEAGQAAPPVDVETIARCLNLEVDYTRRLGEDVSGMLYYGPRRVVIGVNQAKPREHRRFTVAHETAHYVAGHSLDLYLHVASDHEVDDVSIEEERLANYFAAALLMPAEWVRSAVESGVSRFRLARMFDVSPSAMERRLRELGLYPSGPARLRVVAYPE